MLWERDYYDGDEVIGAEIGKIRAEGVKINFEARRMWLEFERKQKINISIQSLTKT